MKVLLNSRRQAIQLSTQQNTDYVSEDSLFSAKGVYTKTIRLKHFSTINNIWNISTTQTVITTTGGGGPVTWTVLQPGSYTPDELETFLATENTTAATGIVWTYLPASNRFKIAGTATEVIYNFSSATELFALLNLATCGATVTTGYLVTIPATTPTYYATYQPKMGHIGLQLEIDGYGLNNGVALEATQRDKIASGFYSTTAARLPSTAYTWLIINRANRGEMISFDWDGIDDSDDICFSNAVLIDLIHVRLVNMDTHVRLQNQDTDFFCELEFLP